MIDWDLALKLTVGGYGTNIVVLSILMVIAWGMGILLHKFAAKSKNKS